MGKYFTSPFLIVIVGVIGIAVFFIVRFIMKLRKRSRKQKADRTNDISVVPSDVQEEKITKEGIINARIYDAQHRSRSLRHVELIKGKDYGRQFLCGTNLVFALKKDDDYIKNKCDFLMPITPPKSMEHPPSELYEALQTKEDVAEVLGNRDESGDKIKLGLLVLAACVALFIMFMAIYKKGGGG
jgi:hypothetical protein